jgi:flagellar capping protein FliD
VLRGVQRSMQSALSGVPGTGAIAGTSGMGLETLQNGSLQLDESLLRDALATAPDDALAILAGPGGVFATMDAGLELVVDPDAGTLTLRTESLDAQIRTRSSPRSCASGGTRRRCAPSS